MRRGKLIVFEGIDGCGKHTQCLLLKRFLLEEKKKFKVFAYPDLSGPLGSVIEGFLNKKINLDKNAQFIVFALNIMAEQEEVRKALEKGKVVILNRYIGSTLAYQPKITELEEKIKFASELNLITPDAVILLDISAETSMKRKYRQKRRNNKSLDRFEEDRKFLSEVRRKYFILSRKNVLCRRWKVIDSEKSKEEVGKEIKDYILSLLK